MVKCFSYLLTYFPSCHRQLGQQQILSISGGLEPVSVRFPMNVPWLSPLPQQYVSMSSLDARVFYVPLVSIRLLLLGWSLDLCVIYGLSISSVYVQLWFLYFFSIMFFYIVTKTLRTKDKAFPMPAPNEAGVCYLV